MRFAVLLCALTMLVGVAGAQEWAKKRVQSSPRHQEWVDVKNGSRTVKCFVMYPEKSEKAPVVVLIHEIFGMSDWVQSVADQLAEHGYIAIAPDLLSGMAPNGGRTTDFDPSKVTEAVSGLPAEQVTGDLNAVCDYAKSIPSTNGKLFVGGFCWGGGQALRFATNRSDLSAAFVFYGTGPKEADSIKRITAPVFGFYGGNDNRVTSTVADQTALMKDAGKKYEATVYEGAGHGFMRAGEAPDASEANKKAHDRAWKKWLDTMASLSGALACCEG